ncbi:MAG: hypothetical protein LUG92_04790 [Oscillospiraceae bacterium]|nr:hypothetical protein [Oscillospiraceae bacterium]
MSRRRAKRALARTLASAGEELNGLRNCLRAAYDAFDTTADERMVEAAIYEINALRSRYDSQLLNCKSICSEET